MESRSLHAFTLATLLGAATAAADTQTLQSRALIDGFEGAWGINEELVFGCSAIGIGQVDRDHCPPGEPRDQCLIVHANSARTTLRNHVIADRFLLKQGILGRWRYEVDARISGETPDGETGPEYSVQSTRAVSSGETRTFIAGVQYQGNPFDPPAFRWAVWTRLPGGGAGWVVILSGVKLQPDVWYRLTLDFDLTFNRYVHFRLASIADGTVLIDRHLGDHAIVAEDRGFDRALHLTLEAQNLNANCTGVTHYKVLYERLRFSPRPGEDVP